MLADPNVVYVLLIIGVIGLSAEWYNLGSLFPGTIGAISLALGCIALGMLPTNWSGLFLLVLAVVLFIVQAHARTVGLPSAGGVLLFVLGSLTLFARPSSAFPTDPEVRPSLWLIGVMAITVSAFFRVVRRVVMTGRAPAATGAETLVGRVGVAASDLAPAGLVRVDGELWSADTEDGHVRAGEEVRVVRVKGIRLTVRHRR
jgi:membrane-bound serine protease (ClpP class)